MNEQLRTPLPLVRILSIVALVLGTTLVESEEARGQYPCGPYSNDVGGPNDDVDQSDLTQYCSNFKDVGGVMNLVTGASFDKTTPTGSNTLDLGIYYDTDSDGFANYAVFVSLTNNGTTIGSKQLYLCSDDSKTAECKPAVLEPETISCELTNPSATDPFPAGEAYPNDARVECALPVSYFTVSTELQFLNACTLSSASIESAKKDCGAYEGGGFITINKSASPIDGTFDFALTSTLPAPDGGDYSPDPLTTSSGTATTGAISVPNSNTAGTFSVNEVNIPAQWTLSEFTCDAGNKGSTGYSGITINSGTEVACTFTNALRYGSLAVTKVVDWNGVTPVEGQTFEICVQGPSYPTTPNCKTFTYPAGLTQTWSDILPGDYAVTETDPGTSWTVIVAGSPATVTTGTTPATATVTNTRKRGSLKVTKTVDWNGVTPVDGQTFEICISGPSHSTPNCKTATYPGTLELTWADLIPGSYAVTETDPGPQWTPQITGSPASVPSDGSQATASVSNTRKLGSLEVTKSVNWNGVTPIEGQEFDICIEGPSYPTPNCKTFPYNGNTQTWTGLIPGSYTVTEKAPGDEWTVAVSGNPATVPTDGGKATASVSNTRKLGSLQVTKTVNWNGVEEDDKQEFEICITGPSYPSGDCKIFDYDGGTETWTNLIPGNYTVTETDPGAIWAVTGSGGQATVPTNGGQATATITNARKLGSLEVTKTVDWKGITEDTGKTFEICIAGPSYSSPNCKSFAYNGGTQTWSDLIPGAYAISETDPGEEWTVEITGSPATVPEDGGSTSAGVSNTRKLGSLKVTKSVVWNGVTPDPAQAFEICISGPSYSEPDCQAVSSPDWAATWSDLIPGAYAVTETDPGTAWIVELPLTDPVVPTNGGQAAATVTNTRKLGGLDVTKVVNWNGVAPIESQTFEICIAGPSYPTPNCKPIGHDGGPLGWTNLVPGDYLVTETDPGGLWKVTINGSPAKVPQDGTTVSATVTNDRRTATVSFLKVVTGGDALPSAWTFDIGGGPQDVASGGDVTLDIGVYTVTEDGGDANNAKYKLDNAEGACSLVDGAIKLTVSDEDEAPTVCTVTNKRKTGTVTIVKNVVGCSDAAVCGADKWTFTIDGYDPLKTGDQITLPTGSYTIVEAGPDGYVASASGACSIQSGQIRLNVVEGTSTCTITNRPNLGLHANKQINVKNPGNEADWYDANSNSEAVPVTEDEPIWYRVCLTNTGEWPLSNLLLEDDPYQWAVDAQCKADWAATTLEPGETHCCIYQIQAYLTRDKDNCDSADGTTCKNRVKGFGFYSGIKEPSNAANAFYEPLDRAGLPVELTSFEAMNVERFALRLSWATASETNNAGFSVEMRKPEAEEFEEMAFVEGAGTSIEAKLYETVLRDLEPGPYVFRLRQVDFDGEETYSPELEVVVTIPDKYYLSNVYPNPFNPTANIRFGTQESVQTRIELYNVRGQMVKVLYEGTPEANNVQTLRITGDELSSGVYFVRIVGPSFAGVQKMVLYK